MTKYPTILRIIAVSVVLALSASVAAEDRSPEALIDAEHWKQARAMVEPMLKANPADARANFLMARCLEASGRYDEAQALAEKAIAREPKNADYHSLLALVNGRQAANAGILRKLGLAHRIRREAETALEINPESFEARIILIEYFYQAPGFWGGDKAKAHTLAEEAVKLDPARGNLIQASLARRDRKPELSAEYYQKAVEANPPSYLALTTVAGVSMRGAQPKFDLAERYALNALALAPDRAPAYSLLTQAYARQERWADLDGILARAEAAVPDNLSPYVQAGRTLLQAGKDLDRAERFFRKYLTQEPELNAPSHAEAYWRLAQTLEKANRKAEAVEALQAALKLNPNLSGAKQDLKRLR